MKKKIKFLDLFAGAGGLSEGFIRAGFEPISHIEVNKDACDTLKTRVTYHWLKEHCKQNLYYLYLKSDTRNKEHLWKLIPSNLIKSVINMEISNKTLSNLFSAIDYQLGNDKIDLIVGGPPCQAFSIVGRARDPKGMKKDQRNFLYKYYVEFLRKYEPKMFIFENVPGILSAENGKHFDSIFKSVRNEGYEVKISQNKYLNSKDFGVLQNRKRVFIIGWKKEFNLKYPEFEDASLLPSDYKILSDLFSDLKPLQQGQGTLNAVKYEKRATKYLEWAKIRNGLDIVTHHIARPNNENDLEIYRIAVDLWNKERKRLNYSELPKHLIKHNNTKSFTNRFQVVDGESISHTIVAHIAMDGHYYIHPDIKQNRSISVREAARIQSFPDDYFFEGCRTSVFKQIGNAVPPLMSEKIAEKIKLMLRSL